MIQIIEDLLYVCHVVHQIQGMSPSESVVYAFVGRVADWSTADFPIYRPHGVPPSPLSVDKQYKQVCH